jgi:hypothetical protein
VYVPRAFAHQPEFLDAVARVAQQLSPEVVEITTEFGHDWTDEPSVFFMAILADAVTGPDRLLSMINKVQDSIFQQVEPMQEWGVNAYFNFRSKSEQEKLDQRVVA